MTQPDDTSASRRVLVIDDDARAGMTVCQLLTSLGFQAKAFTAAAPFLAEVKANPPAVVILDVLLGQTDAIEVIWNLELIGFGGFVLLMSGRYEEALEEIRTVGLRHGLSMLPSLRKPFRLGDVTAAMAATPESGSSLDQQKRGSATDPEPEVRVDFSRALAGKWLELWYQPKIDLKSLKVAGAEALIRARHPEHGIITAAGVLPPAGDPLYRALSDFVIRQAVRDWLHFADAGLPLTLSVNMPISVLDMPDFVSFVRKMLPKDPRFPGLIVEVTEDEIIRDTQRVREIATQLKLSGVSLSIDDFGHAHSSLARMLDLPCAELKLDRSIVAGCASDPRKRAMCETVVDLAHRFELSVCAEGIEMVEDLRCLMGVGCDAGQGYFFAKAMERDAFVSRTAGKTGPPQLRRAAGGGG
jgi:EAL domain-containing protein (putative c-di-GMP-specific phosphodiesterase class I)/ActR/RegA family two-component response regulator